MGLTMSDIKANMRKLVAEFIGTMMLLVSIQMSFGAKEPFAALAVGIVLTVLIYGIGPISGCHINPAVSLSMFLRASMTMSDLLMYWIAQFGGGFTGALLGRIIEGKSIYPAIGETHNFMQAFLAELVFTAFFILIILSVVPKSGKPEVHFGLTIGLTLFASIVCIASVSGASLNPAVALGLVLVKKVTSLHYALWVTCANAAGAIVATFIYFLFDNGDEQMHPDDILVELRDRLLSINPKTAGSTGETDPLLART